MELNSIDEKIQAAAPFIFNGSFPIFDEGYRLPLECKILRHYYFREFSADTDEQFKFYLITRLREIMPRYNQLYKTVLSQFNYLTDYNITTTETEIFGNSGTNDFYNSGEYTNTGSSTTENQGHGTDNNNGENTYTNTGTIDNTTDITGTGHTTKNRNQDETGKNTENTNGTENITGNETSNNTANTDKTFHNLSSDLPQMNYNNIDYGTNMLDSNENTATNSNGSINTNNNKESETNSTTNLEHNTTETENSETENNSKTIGNTQSNNSGNQTNQNNSEYQNNSNSQYNGTNNGSDNRSGWNDFTKSGATQRIRKESGIRGNKSPTELLILYRESIINPDMDIIRDLEDLFIFVYA